MWKIAALVSLTLWALPCAIAQEAASQPATRGAPTTQARLSAFVALIEGQNSPDVRRTGARELLLARRPETLPRIVALLGSTNVAVRFAVASALAELPECLDPMYIEPLMGMLGDSDTAVRDAAAAALAAYPDRGVTPRLRQLAEDAGQPRPIRLAAVNALGLMTDRAAIEALAAVLADSNAAVAQAALAALARATAIDFGDDLEAARNWWAAEGQLSLQAWQERQIARLVHKDRDMRRRLEAIESRLAKVLEAAYQRAPDAERATLLTGYLSDPSATFRLLGLKFAQAHLLEGKSLPSELQERIRELLDSPDAAEQAAAVRAVASFREPRDAQRFMDLLPSARSREVRLALLNGLGHVGTGSATGQLLAVLDDADEPTATETIAALGRLAERGVLGEVSRARVVAVLLAEFEATKPAQVALRERILWAMGNVADSRFGPAFATALERQQPVAVRQAAVRGLAAIKNPHLADVLAAATSDPDAGVRKTAVEALATIGSLNNDKHMQALWDRVVSPQETDETIRQVAWRSVLELLSKSPAAQAERWITRLATTGTPDPQRTTELLERLARILSESEPVDRARLGTVRARLAAQYVAADRPADALAAYLAALNDLQMSKSEAAGRVALDLVRFALPSGRYDQTLATALANGDSAAGLKPLWEMAQALIEQRMNPEGADQALAMLTALEEYPPGTWPDDVKARIAELRQRASQLKAPPRDTGPASRPTTRAAPHPSR